MTTICAAYLVPPTFPATDQHPDAVRYGPFDIDGESWWTDAVGGEPSEVELRALVAPLAEPASTPPRMVAAAFGVAIQNGDVTAIQKTYHILALLYLGVGTFLLFFSEEVQESEYYVILSNGVVVTVTERGEGYATLETRDLSGALFDPPQFDIQVYSI